MDFVLRATAKEHKIIAAHRGVAGGNIPCNTLPAYEIALKQGADMLETDIDCTADGHLVIFHPGMERHHLNRDVSISQMTLEEVKTLRYVNYDRTPTQFGILTFDEFLETYKNRCYINVDKFWGNPEAIYHTINGHSMIDQVLVKSAVSDEVLRVLEQLAPELPFIPIVRDTHPCHEMLKTRNVNYVGPEVLFSREDSPVASGSFIDQMHRDDKLVWVNTIIYDHLIQLSGAHSDDAALCSSMEDGWGWIGDRGFDIIQTDWTQMLIDYLKKTGKYYR